MIASRVYRRSSTTVPPVARPDRTAALTSRTSIRRMPSGAGPEFGGTSAVREAEPGRLGEAARDARHPADLAGETDLAERDSALWTASCDAEDAMASAMARSAAGSVMPHPADGRGVDVGATWPTLWVAPGSRSWRAARAPPAPARPGCRRARRSCAAARRRRGRASACTSATSGRRPSSVTVTQVPGAGSVRDAERNSPLGSASPMDAVVGELEAADLVGRPEAVLHRADHAQRRVALALEVQHDVHEVLEQPRPGDRAVLGDVADQDDGHARGPWRPGSARRRPRGPG